MKGIIKEDKDKEAEIKESKRIMAIEAIDILIKVILLIPYTIFRNFIEPKLILMSETIIVPFFENYLIRIPLMSFFLRFLGCIATKCRTFVNFLCRSPIHDNHRDHIVEVLS